MCQADCFYYYRNMAQTLTDIVNEIKPRRNSSLKHPSCSSHPSSTLYNNFQQSKINYHQNHKHWTHQQNTIFHYLVSTYGTDFSLILGELPGKTRKQVKRKFNKTELSRRRQAVLRRRSEQRRKLAIFECDILELPTFAVEYQTHKPKPNNPID